MTTVEVFAPAKINLTLHVTGRRDDGYHLLDSLVVFATDIGDRLRVEPAESLTLHVEGPRAAGVPTDGSNLVLRAARLLQDARRFDMGAKLTLEKHLPHGGGVGGGSADAAAAIRALAQLWGVPPLDAREARAIGADLPVCLAGPQPARMRGTGEHVETVPALPNMGLVLVNPGQHVSTAQVFAVHDRLYGDGQEMDPLPSRWDFEGFHIWLLGQRNDLTKCTMELVDEVGSVLNVLRGVPGCLDADMSGSGSTCWGLFQSPESARSAADILGRTHPEWWVKATALS